MKALAAAAAGAALIALALPGASQAQNAPFGIPGYLNPSTGLFTARPALLPATTALQRSGTITVTVTVTLGLNIPKSVALFCGVEISSFDSEYDNFASGTIPLKRSGRGGTCKVSVPFIFEIASAKTLMTINASVNGSTATTPSLTYNASFGFSPFPVSNGNKNVAIALAM